MKKGKRVQRGTNGDGTGFGHVKPHHFIHGLLFRTLVFLLPVFPSFHPTHWCHNHHARAPTPHIYRSTAAGPAFPQHLHQAVTILFHLQTRKQKSQEGSQEGCSSLEDHDLVHCSLT